MKTTSPLAKAITTLEGQIVVVTNLVLGVGAALPAHVIPPKIAAYVAGGLNVALIVQRLILKVQASKTQSALVSALGDGNLSAAEAMLLLQTLGGELPQKFELPSALAPAVPASKPESGVKPDGPPPDEPAPASAVE